MNGVRPISPEELTPKIDEETKLISMMAATIYASGSTVGVASAVERAYSILDGVLSKKDERLKVAYEIESKRRKGY